MANWFICSWRRVLSWFKDDVFRRLLKNVGWLLSGSFIATFLGLISTVVKTRALGAEMFGLLAVIMAYVAIVQRLTAFQPWLALIKYGAEALELKRPHEFMGIVKLGLLLDVIGAVSGTLIAASGAYVFARWQGWNQEISHMAAVFSISILFSLSGTPIGILRLLDRFRVFAAQKILAAILGLVGALIVYATGGGIWGFLIVLLLSGIFGNLFLLVMAYLALRESGLTQYWRAPITNWKPFLRFSGWTYTTSTLDIPVKQLDIIIVSAVVSLEAAGIYKVIKQIAQLLAMMADSVYQAVYPQFAAMIANSDGRSAVKYAVKTGSLTMAVVGPVALLLAAFSPWWLGAVFGEAFAAGWLPLSVFLFFNIIAMACITIHPLFTAMGYVKKNVFILLVANAGYLVLAWLLGNLIGLLGLAIAFGVQLLIVVTLKSSYIYRGVVARTESLEGKVYS